MRMRDNARYYNNAVEHHARAAYIMPYMYMHMNTPLLFYDLSLAARSAPSQLCYDSACSGCSYVMEYTEWVQQEATEASHPACNIIELWATPEDIIFIWACIVTRGGKDDKARFFIHTFKLKICPHIFV